MDRGRARRLNVRCLSQGAERKLCGGRGADPLVIAGSALHGAVSRGGAKDSGRVLGLSGVRIGAGAALLEKEGF